MVVLNCTRSGWSTVRDPETGERVSLSGEVDPEVAARLVERYDPVSYAGDPPDSNAADGDDAGDDGDEESEVEPPFDVTEKTVSEVEEELGAGGYSDGELEALKTAEENSKDRTGVYNAIDDARED